MNYYVSNDGKIYGPIDEAKIRSKIAQGFFSRNCLVSLDRNEWTRPVTESAAAANARNPDMQPEAALSGAAGTAAAAPNPGNVYAIPLVPVGAEDRSRKKRRIAIWIVVIIVLLLIAGAVAVLAVDVLLLDRQLFSRIEDLFSGIF